MLYTTPVCEKTGKGILGLDIILRVVLNPIKNEHYYKLTQHPGLFRVGLF